jgi:hypothetical protein
MMLLLWIVGEIMNMWYECGWVILLMITYALGVAKCCDECCDVWWIFVKLVKQDKFKIGEFKWVNDVVVLK